MLGPATGRPVARGLLGPLSRALRPRQSRLWRRAERAQRECSGRVPQRRRLPWPTGSTPTGRAAVAAAAVVAVPRRRRGALPLGASPGRAAAGARGPAVARGGRARVRPGGRQQARPRGPLQDQDVLPFPRGRMRPRRGMQLRARGARATWPGLLGLWPDPVALAPLSRERSGVPSGRRGGWAEWQGAALVGPRAQRGPGREGDRACGRRWPLPGRPPDA